MKTLKTEAAIVALACFATAFAADRSEWMRELERVCSFIPSDRLRVDAVRTDPSPDDVKAKYGISDAEIVDGLDEIVTRLWPVATNRLQMTSRWRAVCWIGKYGTTNDVGRLSSVTTNSNDYAQKAAVSACLTLLRTSPELIPTARGVVTNDVMFSDRVRAYVYVQLYGFVERPGIPS